MKYFVYHTTGSCNEGDHDFDLTVFDEDQDAYDHVRHLRERYGDEVTVVLIEGRSRPCKNLGAP